MSRLRVLWSRGPNFDPDRRDFAEDNRNQAAFAVFREPRVTPSRYRRGGVDPERPRGGDVA